MGKFTEEVQKARIDFAAGIFEKKPDISLLDVIRKVKKQFGSGMTYSTVHVARDQGLEQRRMQGLRKNHVKTFQDKETVVAKKAQAAVIDISKGDEAKSIQEVEQFVKDSALLIMNAIEATPIVEVRIFKYQGKFQLTLGVERVERKNVELRHP
jgi:hypothetical protein